MHGDRYGGVARYERKGEGVSESRRLCITLIKCSETSGCGQLKPQSAFWPSVSHKCSDCILRAELMKVISRKGFCRSKYFIGGRRIVDGLKRCVGKWGCDKWLPVSEFSDSKRGPHTTCRACLRNHARTHRYGITPAEYNAILDKQLNKCGICRTREPGKTKLSFSVDHDHTTGKVRGLLCEVCNLKLGIIERYSPEERPELMQRALTYIQTPPYMKIERKRKRKRKQPHQHPRSPYENWIWLRYRMLESEVGMLYHLQGNRCAVCLCQGNVTQKYHKMVIDHKGDDIRGILCQSCNIGPIAWLDLFQADDRNLKAASMLDYLERSKAYGTSV